MLNKIFIFTKSLFIIVAVFSVLILFIVTTMPNLLGTIKTKKVSELVIQKVNANEIYPEFICGCCGEVIDLENICCGMAKNIIDFIDKQMAKNISKDEVIINTVKEFGFDSLSKEKTKKELKIKLAQNAPTDAPKISFENRLYDFGSISQKDGIVSTLFNFKNEGKSDLIIDKISTSCGCTSASIIYKDKEGPTFTMPGHGKENPKNWSISIAPGNSARVKVYYDPNAHGVQKEKERAIIRTVDIFSNDPIEFKKQIRIELNQLP